MPSTSLPASQSAAEESDAKRSSRGEKSEHRDHELFFFFVLHFGPPRTVGQKRKMPVGRLPSKKQKKLIQIVLVNISHLAICLLRFNESNINEEQNNMFTNITRTYLKNRKNLKIAKIFLFRKRISNFTVFFEFCKRAAVCLTNQINLIKLIW